MTSGAQRFTRILLLEDNPGDARLVRELLRNAQANSLTLDLAESLDQAQRLLAAGPYDAAVIDLTVPDSQGIATFRAIHAAAPSMPVVVLSGLSDEEIAVRSVQEGAQDYLIKGRVDGDLLVRALRYAIERQQLEQQRRDFVAMVSHELRNPLATILTWSEILRSTDQLNERAVDVIIDQATHLDRLIRDLVDVAALDARQLHLNRSTVDIVQLTRECIERAQRTTDQHEISLIADASGVSGFWDPDRVQQIVDNLLSNASKYSLAGGPITVQVAGAGDLVRLSVTDPGLGLGPDVLQHLFSRFYRSEIARASRNPGLGLGLHIAHSLAEAHGGTIQAASPGEGQGSTFTVTLPRAPSDE